MAEKMALLKARQAASPIPQEVFPGAQELETSILNSIRLFTDPRVVKYCGEFLGRLRNGHSGKHKLKERLL